MTKTIRYLHQKSFAHLASPYESSSTVRTPAFHQNRPPIQPLGAKSHKKREQLILVAIPPTETPTCKLARKYQPSGATFSFHRFDLSSSRVTMTRAAACVTTSSILFFPLIPVNLHERKSEPWSTKAILSILVLKRRKAGRRSQFAYGG
jgi:hypothetical protein